MRGISFVVSPIRDHAFFEQPILQGEVRYAFLQIAGLTAQNYLEKSPVDGRSFALSLTPRGEEARARVDGIMDAHEAGFARLLADVDQQQLRAALSLIASGRD